MISNEEKRQSKKDILEKLHYFHQRLVGAICHECKLQRTSVKNPPSSIRMLFEKIGDVRSSCKPCESKKATACIDLCDCMDEEMKELLQEVVRQNQGLVYSVIDGFGEERLRQIDCGVDALNTELCQALAGMDCTTPTALSTRVVWSLKKAIQKQEKALQRQVRIRKQLLEAAGLGPEPTAAEKGDSGSIERRGSMRDAQRIGRQKGIQGGRPPSELEAEERRTLLVKQMEERGVPSSIHEAVLDYDEGRASYRKLREEIRNQVGQLKAAGIRIKFSETLSKINLALYLCDPRNYEYVWILKKKITEGLHRLLGQELIPLGSAERELLIEKYFEVDPIDGRESKRPAQAVRELRREIKQRLDFMSIMRKMHSRAEETKKRLR